MDRMKFLMSRWPASLLAAIVFLTLPAVAQPVQHLSTTQPGGMPGVPVMGGMTLLTNGCQITWDGPSGYYQVFQRTNLLNGSWVTWGLATNLQRNAVISEPGSNAFFRVSGPAPKYAGYRICISCHLSECRYETNTAHASAFSDPLFQAAGGQTNASCLACHTVGYGMTVNGAPVGFVNAATTPQFEGVQCENCHGPAANHAGSEDDPTIRPQVEVAATVCGGCHNANRAFPNPPTFNEWSSSGHATVVPVALQVMASATNNINSCGVCHSGSARLAFISGQNPSATLANDYNVPITCAVCHDPHATNAQPAQLRNPLHSTNDFHLTAAATASVGAFTNQYNANSGINLCAQCHNDRGASWTDTSFPPHHSLQYNYLLATVGVLAPFYPAYIAAHAGLPGSAAVSVSGTFYLTNQCAACHMQPDSGVVAAPRHTFVVVTNTCANCHDVSQLPSLPLAGFSSSLSNQIAGTIDSLNMWAASKAPALLQTNGAVPWEYPTSDGLSWTLNASGHVAGWTQSGPAPASFNGPAAALQSSLTNYPGIMKARFDLYLVLNDGSYGAHNYLYSIFLLNSAQYYIQQAMTQ
jgi:cytochrome c553